MSDPFWHSYPTDPAIRNRLLPRNLVHSYATDVDDATVLPRWGKIGKQRIIDEGPLAPRVGEPQSRSASMAAMRCRKISRFSTGIARAAVMMIFNWMSVRPIMCR
jgi:hypothetical protein